MSTPTTVVYTFNPASSGGVSGTITTVVGAPGSAEIKANLDLTNANWSALQAFDGNCTGSPVTEFTWHIHSVWNNTKSSEFTTGCSLAKAGNHYDPDFACGPNSEYIKDPKCAGKTYACNTTTYAANPSACEKGDLSGHVGKMKATDGKIVASWSDKGNYPSVAEHKPTWNIMLHAVCGSVTPRFICATGAVSTESLDAGSNCTNATNPSTTKANEVTTPAPGTVTTTTAAPTTTKANSAVKVSVLAALSMAVLAALF
ncbi:unnamed protein product [Aphanomyces euteiches]